jgi:hypothetical protein
VLRWESWLRPTCSPRSFASLWRSAKLALALLRSLDDEPEPDAAGAWDDEIERRGAEVDAGTADTLTLDEYRAHVRQRRAARVRR